MTNRYPCLLLLFFSPSTPSCGPTWKHSRCSSRSRRRRRGSRVCTGFLLLRFVFRAGEQLQLPYIRAIIQMQEWDSSTTFRNIIASLPKFNLIHDLILGLISDVIWDLTDGIQLEFLLQGRVHRKKVPKILKGHYECQRTVALNCLKSHQFSQGITTNKGHNYLILVFEGVVQMYFLCLFVGHNTDMCVQKYMSWIFLLLLFSQPKPQMSRHMTNDDDIPEMVAHMSAVWMTMMAPGWLSPSCILPALQCRDPRLLRVLRTWTTTAPRRIKTARHWSQGST